MKNYGKRIVSFVMMFLICAVTVFGSVNTAKATEVTDGVTDTTTDGTTDTTTDGTTDTTTDGTTDTTTETEPEYIVLLEEAGYASANTQVSHNFSVDSNEQIVFTLWLSSAIDTTLTITDKAGYSYTSGTILASELYYDAESGWYGYAFYEPNMPVGDYTISFVTKAGAQYEVYVDLYELEPVLNHKKLTITAGMKEKLKVENTDEKIKWKSNKKSVATVNAKGVVKAKKAGKATITATTESGVVLKCTVTVKENKYTETKLTVQDLREAWYDAVLQVYEASYDSKGNLVLKCRFVNNTGYKVTELEDIEVTMYSDEGKEIGTYTSSSKKMTVENGQVKDFTVTIEKSKLKIKNADLRNAYPETDGIYIYYY